MQLSPYASIGAKLVDAGYSAIPIMPETKRPGSMQMGKWYGRHDWQIFCDRMPTDIELSIWSKWTDAGVCVAVDKTLKVIDIDTDDAALMTAVLSVLPDSPVKKRGNKGFSAFYRGSDKIVNVPFSIPVPNGKPVRVVDLLAHGRQTVLPPTIHPSTMRPYEWLTSDTLVDTAMEQLPELPDDIGSHIGAVLAPFGWTPLPDHKMVPVGDNDNHWREIKDLAFANLDAWVPALKLPDTKRARNGTYRAVAVWRGVDNPNLSFTPQGITDWGTSENHSPIDIVMKSLGVDLDMATRWLADQLGHKPKTADGFDVGAFIERVTKVETPAIIKDTNDELPEVKAPRATVSAFDFDTQGDLLGDLSSWIYESARAPVAEFATIASVSFLSAFFGRRYVTPTGAGLNLYLIGIAGPGFGKDHPRRAIEMLGHDAQFQWLIGPNEVTSDSSIEKVLRKRPCFVMPWDEIGVMLQGVSGKQSQSWTRSIRKALLELYSKSTGIWTGKEHADSKTDSSGEPIHCPTVSVLGFSTPTEFYEGITDQNLKDGMVARMTVIEAKKRPERHDTPPLLKVPADLVTALRTAYSAAPKAGNLTSESARDPKRKPILHAAKWGDGAAERWRGIETWQLDQIDEKPDFEGIVGRAAEQTIKLATIRAVGRDQADPIVEIEDVEWGYSLVQASLDTIDEGVRKHMAGSDFEKLCKIIEEVVIRGGEDGVSKTRLMQARGVSKANNRERDECIKWLTEAARIMAKITTGAGRPGVRYFALKQDANN